MIHAYDKVYLEKGRIALARMLDFAVNELHYDITDFWNWFLVSGIAQRFGNGDFTLLVGKSGVELAYAVLENSGVPYERIKPKFAANRSEEYWLGWALAYYQWDTALSFSEITKYTPITKIRNLYSPYHEMDVRQFVDKMKELYKTSKSETNLKQFRKRAGYSQKELADLTGIPLRTIQQYEQRQKNINKAQAEYLFRIAKVLHCNGWDLMELVE